MGEIHQQHGWGRTTYRAGGRDRRGHKGFGPRCSELIVPFHPGTSHVCECIWYQPRRRAVLRCAGGVPRLRYGAAKKPVPDRHGIRTVAISARAEHEAVTKVGYRSNGALSSNQPWSTCP
jgi:hypothetical protein